MTDRTALRVAVIADAHFHDVHGDFGVPGVQTASGRMTLRSLSETLRAQRLVNESRAALTHALTDIAARGIRLVVLLGDYSDDGQAGSVAGLHRLLEDYRTRFGIRFLALPGNHDMYGAFGRHRSRRYQAAAGGHDLATSDAGAQDATARQICVTPAMHCAGIAEAMQALPDVGYFRQSGDLHWETPFGPDDRLSARMPVMAQHQGSCAVALADASYLVEPQAGHWFLMIDANVFLPSQDGAQPGWTDASDAGWTAMLHHKRHILRWIADVSTRAAKTGKDLIAFSHYPAVDALDGTGADETALFGPTMMTRRSPDNAVAKALSAAGLRVHVSGHLHVNDTSRYRGPEGSLVNISLPSLVGFPAAYKILTTGRGGLVVQTVDIGAMQPCADIATRYRAEAAQTGLDARHLAGTLSYGAMLEAHIGHLVGRRFLRRDWPADLVAAIRGRSLGDLALMLNPDLQNRAAFDAIPAEGFVKDWYCLRMGSDLGLATIDAARLVLYDRIAGFCADPDLICRTPGAARLRRVFRMFEQYRRGLPSQTFRVDPATGEVTALATDATGTGNPAPS